MHAQKIIAITLAFGMSASTFAKDLKKIGTLEIGRPHARATVPAQRSASAYFSISNHGKDRDKLIAATSPVAKSVEFHTMSMDGDVMKMREVDAITVASGEKVEMQAGSGYHLMLIGLHKQLKPGDSFPLTLTFDKAGKTTVLIHVDGKSSTNAHHGH